jgi:hypothetical protein
MRFNKPPAEWKQITEQSSIRPFRLKSREGRGQTINIVMRISPYDDIGIVTSLKPQSVSGSSAVDGASVDSQGYENAMIHVYACEATGSPSAASLAVTLQESLDGTDNWTNALDNTGAVIGFTLNAEAGDAFNSARIEGLNLNRKRYLRAVITPTFTGGSSPASVVYGQIVFGAAQVLPVRSANSNT